MAEATGTNCVRQPAAMAIMLLAGLAVAAPAGAQGLPLTRHEADSRVVVRADGTYRAEQTIRTKILSDKALASASATSISFIEGMETLTVTAAAIEKSDGSQQQVDLASIKTLPAAAGQPKDTRFLVIPFAAFEVGDTLVYTTVRDVTQTAFNTHFSYAWTFARSQPWARATYSIKVPPSLKLHVDIVDGGGALKHERVDATADAPTVEHRLTYEPSGNPVAEEPGAVAAVDRDPGFTLTTSADHESFAAAYWQEASRRITVTPAIAALAAEITRDQASPRDKVIAIDRWMKRNIRYTAVYLGRERWVPQATTEVLALRAGDCKDHAVLMSALLEAVGLASEHVLVNLGTAYGLPKLPPATFNHIMVQVPQAELTLDPAAPLSATGVLSLQAYDKPTVQVGKAGTRLARTPPMQAAEHSTTAKTTMKVSASGAVTGETTQSATGIFANSARSAYLRFQVDGPARAAEQRLTALGTSGSGTFTASSPSELSEPYVVKATFVLADQAELPLSGNRRLPVGLPVHARPGAFLLGPRVANRRAAFVCFAGTQVEDIEITFAEGLALPRVPAAKKVETRVFTYEARYALDGRTFKAKRTFTSSVPGQVCPASLEADIDEPLKEVQTSLGTVMVFPISTSTIRKRP